MSDWRRRHGVLVGVWQELGRLERHNHDGVTSAAAPARAIRALPRDTTHYIGRTPELADVMTFAENVAETVGIQVIGGMAGIGKTAFAVHAAHQLAKHFPDGQIFLALHGHTSGRQPLNSADALASLLQSAGLPMHQIPASLEDRSALWRDRLAGRRVILVLDDASSSAQIEPLLPGTAGALALVTSRRHLTALDNVRSITLETLLPEEAADLFVRLADRKQLDPANPPVADIARLCGYLPLAIGMLARQLHHHPSWTPAGLATDLAVARDRLDLMTTEDLSVAAALHMSYQDLAPDEQRLFRRLGLHLGTDIDAWAAAALDGTSTSVTQRRLAVLYDHYLLTEPAPGRYRPHDLVRGYARSLAVHHDSEVDRNEALSRLLDYYQTAAAAADRHLTRHTRKRSRAVVLAPRIPEFLDRPQALAWIRAERVNMFASLDHVTATEQFDRIVGMTAALASILQLDGPWSDAVSRHAVAVQAVRQVANQESEAQALHDLGVAQGLAADYPAAISTLQLALSIYRDVGDAVGEANALNNVGMFDYLIGDYPCAISELGKALDIYRKAGDQLGEVTALMRLGHTRRLTGHYLAAAHVLGEALNIAQNINNRFMQGRILGMRGDVSNMMGHGAAESEAQAALSISREVGDLQGESLALIYLTVSRRLAGDHISAAELIQEALRITREFGDRAVLSGALIEACAVYRSHCEVDYAIEFGREALSLAREMNCVWDEASALAELGRCSLTVGLIVEGQAMLTEAREIFVRIGAPGGTGMGPSTTGRQSCAARDDDVLADDVRGAVSRQPHEGPG